jgi:hypothetical protein
MSMLIPILIEASPLSREIFHAVVEWSIAAFEAWAGFIQGV